MNVFREAILNTYVRPGEWVNGPTLLSCLHCGESWLETQPNDEVHKPDCIVLVAKTKEQT